MSEVASKDLCAELYELSGWGKEPNNPSFLWYDSLGQTKTLYGFGEHLITPAYSLGYLLRKLPEFDLWFDRDDPNHYYIDNCGQLGKRQVTCTADTPEDAACKLAIQLFKQGVLTKETV